MLTYVIGALVLVTVFSLLMVGFFWRHYAREKVAALRRRLGTSDKAGLDLFTNQNRKWLDRMILESGAPWTRTQIIQWSAGMAAGGMVAGIVLERPPLAVIGALAGLAVMPLRLYFRREERLRKCDQQFPQALRLVTLSLRAGQALPSALALAAREGPAPIRDELKLTVDENALGVDMGTVLDHLAQRLYRCEAARTLCVAVRVLEQTGGNLITVVDNIIESAQARTQYEAKMRAMTSQGRMSAWIVGSIPPAFFLLVGILDSNYWKTLFTDPAGPLILGAGVGLWLCGLLWTRRIVKKASSVTMS